MYYSYYMYIRCGAHASILETINTTWHRQINSIYSIAIHFAYHISYPIGNSFAENFLPTACIGDFGKKIPPGKIFMYNNDC